MMFLRKLGVILYKNLLLRRTQWFMTAMELLLPIALVALVCWKIPSYECVRDGEKGTIEKPYPPSNAVVKLEGCGSMNISYAPANAKTRAAADELKKTCGGNLNIQEHHNETIFEKELKNASDSHVGIVFPDNFETLLDGKVENKVISYKIRMHADIATLPNTEKVLPTQKLGDKDFSHYGLNYEHGLKYTKSNFLNLQYALDKVLIEMITGRKLSYEIAIERLSIYLDEGQFVYENTSNDGATYGIFLVHILLSFSVLFALPTITRNVVSEKQTGIAELLKSTGVSGGIQWLGWMINSLVPFLFSMSMCTLLLFSRVSEKVYHCESEAYLVKSDWTLVGFILFLYILATIAICFFVCSVVKKPTIATTIAVLISVISTFLYLIAGNQVALLVFPNCAMTYAFIQIAKLEISVLDDSDRPYGAQWDWEGLNYAFPEYKSPDDFTGVVYDVSLLQIIGMMIAEIIVYSLAALYFENVLPSEHGVRRPWYLFNLSEMFNRRGKRRPVQAPTQVPLEMGAEVDKLEVPEEQCAGEGAEGTSIKEKVSSAGTDVEGPPKSEPDQGEMIANSSFEPEVRKNEQAIGIEIQNMYKNFGSKRAVNGVSLSMYTGDIFALLGHNGAGKTTLISMITGFFSPTSGTAIVDGHDIRKDMARAREHMGLCPQHNMLFDNIPVIKQLIIFGMLRGMTRQQAKQQAEYLLFKMNLLDKKTTLAKKLSGGQKRKLSLGLALIGGTKVVILDEPTSGMDPQARREIWDLLLELRGERTILLTTHFMEEADVLGDRIGIMAAGRLQCIGTTAFLKKYYGTGLNLKLTLKQPDQDPSKTNELAENQPGVDEQPKTAPENPNVPKIVSLVQKHISDASVKREARSFENNEVFLTLPAESATTAALTKMFTDLSGNKDKFGIQTIGLQQTTMDEVFLRVGELAAEEEHGPTQKYVWSEDDFGKAPKVFGMKKIVGQFVILLRKKWIVLKRKWLLLLLEAIIPFLLILGAIIILQKQAKRTSEAVAPKPSPLAPEPHPQAPGSPQRAPEPDPQSPLLISLEKYASPISYYYASEDPNLESHIQAVLGSSSQKYVDTSHHFTNGLAEVGKLDKKKFKRRMIIAVTAVPSNSTVNITGYYNSYPYHSAPLALNTATNIALRAMDPSGNNKIQVTNHPWIRPPQTSEPTKMKRNYDDDYDGPTDQVTDRCEIFYYSVEDIGGAILLLLAFILFTTTFIVGPVEEKVTNVKQLQLMTGLQPVIYWLAHFLWDYTLYFLAVILTLILVAIFEHSGYQYIVENHGAGVLFFILMCYGFSFLALNYLLSLRSTTVAGGFALVTSIHLLTGIILGFVVLALTVEPDGLYYYINLAMKVLGYFFPSMPALLALVKFTGRAGSNKGCGEGPGKVKCCSYLQWSGNIPTRGGPTYAAPGVGQELFFVLLVGVIFVTLLMLVEYKVFWRIFGRETPPPFPPNIYDDDVYQEAERVNTLVHSGQVGMECMVIQNLSKAFKGFAAVSQVNFDVHYGECFGLLGVNGAGKTTVFKMITGEELPSEGVVYGFGTTTVQKPRFFFSNIGYCPQFDAIIVVFTGREMLELFGVLRGLPFRGAKMEAIKWLQRFGLIESADVRCGLYSGGMKRRLSTAMAMIGDPALLLLDEPTSGVDPVSRHQFWGILEKIRDSGKSIILTSHSMDECEALCSRLGIMVNGQFQCFGGVQHLKSKFAQGYSLLIKLKPDLPFGTPEVDERLTKFQEKINETFQPCSLKDKHENLLQYHLENPAVSWDVLFKQLEDVKAEFEDMIEDYSVNETSLEEVFLAFARSQYGERRVEVTTCAQICTCSC